MNKLDEAIEEQHRAACDVYLEADIVIDNGRGRDRDFVAAMQSLSCAVDRWRIARDNVRALLPRQQG